MTLLLLGVGAILAAAGTRAAALALGGAAVVGAVGDNLPAATAWIAATAAGFAVLSGSPRRLALPVLGAAAALSVGSARNAAVVLSLWVLATGASVLARGEGYEGRRWALTLCAADLPVVVAVAWTAATGGFEGWPDQLGVVGGGALLVSAVIRAPLASGPQEATVEAGLVAVRAQTAVLILLALGVQELDRSFLMGVLVLAAAGFVVGGLARRAQTRDVVQEMALLSGVLAAARLGWGPEGWEWGALAAGTLIHHLRLRVDPHGVGGLAGVLLSGGGLGLPFLPVVLAALEGSLRAGGWLSAALAVGLVGGLATRAWAGGSAGQPEARGIRAEVRTGVVVAISIGMALWPALLVLQPSPGADVVSWPPLWAAAILVAAAAWGARGEVLVVEPRPSGSREPQLVPDLRLPARWASTAAMTGSFAVLAALAATMWAVGILRGFL